jgi:hypothetical protein
MIDPLDAFYVERKYSSIIEEFPDKEKYPLFYNAKSIEYNLYPGEKLFIPSGWWHFVFSEETDEKTGLNVALNFWYGHGDWVEGSPITSEPTLTKHDITFNPLTEMQQFGVIPVKKSKNRCFPSNVLMHKYKDILSVDNMTFDEFYETKNPRYYIVQGTHESLNKLALPYKEPLYQSAAWVNFGNAITSPHYDLKDNYLCQIQGKKRIILYHPDQRPFMYPINTYDINLINEIWNKFSKDEYILHKVDFLDKFTLEYLLKLIDTNDIYRINKKGIITQVYIDLINRYSKEEEQFKNYLASKYCILRPSSIPSYFVIEKSKPNMIPRVNDYQDSCMTILFILTDGFIMIKGKEYKVHANNIYMFPSSITHGWASSPGTVIMYPVFE